MFDTKRYKDIAEKRSDYYTKIESSFDIVKKFIVDKKRILYGGTSIDLNLKLVDHPGIYAEDAIPDYDFFSPDFYNESNELAQILNKAGFENVSAINAAHYNSRRVRINFIPVADITYVPEIIYNKIPYNEIKIAQLSKKGSNSKELKYYDGIKIVHPDFQRLDLHRSFCTPYSNPPIEVVLHRLEKDQKRFRLLDQEYKIHVDAKLLGNLPKKEIRVKFDEIRNHAINGIVAYALIRHLIVDLVSANHQLLKDGGVYDFIVEQLNEIIETKLEILHDTLLVLYPKILGNLPVSSYIDSKDLIPANTSPLVKYNRFLDNLRPETFVADREFYFISNELLPVYYLDEIKMKDIHLPGSNAILLYFLQKSIDPLIFESDYRSLYASLLKLITIAEKIRMVFEDNNKSEFMPFFFPTHVYGKSNYSIDHMCMLKEKYWLMNEIPFQDREILRSVFGYYPASQSTWISFDISKSIIYNMDGLKQ
jgi:hypothetical protein